MVDQDGYVVAVGGGKCSIAAFNADNVMANCMINIDSDAVREVILDRNMLTLNVSDTYRFETNVDPSTLKWKSSHPLIAEVESDGFLAAKASGTVMITATSSSGYTAAGVVSITDIDSDVEEIEVDAVVNDMPFDIYTLQGVCIKRDASQADVDALTPGIYIIGGRKVLVK